MNLVLTCRANEARDRRIGRLTASVERLAEARKRDSAGVRALARTAEAQDIALRTRVDRTQMSILASLHSPVYLFPIPIRMEYVVRLSSYRGAPLVISAPAPG
jgi:hypothetical protein